MLISTVEKENKKGEKVQQTFGFQILNGHKMEINTLLDFLIPCLVDSQFCTKVDLNTKKWLIALCYKSNVIKDFIYFGLISVF